MSPPFIIYGLPRSRTYWLSRFLTFGGWTCAHDEARHVRSMEDVKSWLSMPMTGTVETAAAPWWRLVQDMRPDIKTVVVRRPVDDVVASLLRTGVPFDEAKLRHAMTRIDAKLDQIAVRVPGCVSVTFDDLREQAVCARVFEHCLPFAHHSAWWAAMAPLNLQVDFPSVIREYAAFKPQIEAAARTAGQYMRVKMMRRPVVSTEFVFAQENLETVVKEGQHLGFAHLTAIGEPPENAVKKNWALMQKLENIGALHVTTARQNGRLFGYLVSLIAPSLECADWTEGSHLSFFTSPDAPGLGLKLQRASVEFLRSKGVNKVFFRSGVRGAGPRMGAVYKRLGAEPFGEMFSLDLKEAV